MEYLYKRTIYTKENIRKMNSVTLKKAARRALVSYYDYLREVFSLKCSYSRKVENTLQDNYLALLEECFRRGLPK